MLNLSDISPLPNSVIEFLYDLTRHVHVSRLIVFGSRANMDYEEYSDLDLAVDAPSISKKDWLKIRDTAYYDVRTVLQLSLIHWNINPIRLQSHIIKTGKIIYVKKKKA